MPQILEVCMMIFFGAAWPLNILKSFKSRTTQGKSIRFMLLVWSAYAFGIASKIVSGNINYVIAFYILNILMVSTDMVLYVRNKKLDTTNNLNKANA